MAKAKKRQNTERVKRAELIAQLERHMDPYKIKYAHFGLGHGGATVAMTVINNEIIYGVSFCAPGDQFNRQLGRLQALRRLVGKNTRCFLLTDLDLEKTSAYDVMETVLIHHLETQPPNWALDEVEYDFAEVEDEEDE